MIKKVTSQQELEQIRELACYAFNSEHTEEQKQAYLKKNQETINYVVTNELDLITSQVICYPFHVMMEGQKMKMAGIGDVASYPETRGNGSIKNLFSTIFNDLYQNGTSLSYLAPFSQPFYRKFGYETIFYNNEIRIPKGTITQLTPENAGYIERVLWENDGVKKTIKKLYEGTLGKQNGTLIRPDFWWDYFLNTTTGIKIAICYDEDKQATGYLFYQLKGSTEFVIKELAYKNTLAMKQLLTFISSHSGSFESFVSYNFTDDMLLTQFSETQGIEQTIHSGMMVRIVSIKAFIEEYHFKNIPETLTFYLDIIDDFCKWNHGVFKVTIKNGQATCTKENQSDRIDYRGTIQNWTPIFMGNYSLNQSVKYALITRESTDSNLSDLIKTAKPRLYDYF